MIDLFMCVQIVHEDEEMADTSAVGEVEVDEGDMGEWLETKEPRKRNQQVGD